MLLALWWTQPDLNRQPQACKASALPVRAMGPYRVRVCGPHSLGNNMFGNTKYSDWWGIRDSNPYAFRHMILSHARLPIPPIPHMRAVLATPAYIYEKRYAKTSCGFLSLTTTMEGSSFCFERGILRHTSNHQPLGGRGGT